MVEINKVIEDLWSEFPDPLVQNLEECWKWFGCRSYSVVDGKLCSGFCPFCKTDKDMEGGIQIFEMTLDTADFHCSGCDNKGDAWDLWAKFRSGLFKSYLTVDPSPSRAKKLLKLSYEFSIFPKNLSGYYNDNFNQLCYIIGIGKCEVTQGWVVIFTKLSNIAEYHVISLDKFLKEYTVVETTN